MNHTRREKRVRKLKLHWQKKPSLLKKGQRNLSQDEDS